jgi:hypothetical protein
MSYEKIVADSIAGATGTETLPNGVVLTIGRHKLTSLYEDGAPVSLVKDPGGTD